MLRRPMMYAVVVVVNAFLENNFSQVRCSVGKQYAQKKKNKKHCSSY